VSQVLTLLTTPIIYLYMDRLGVRLTRRGRKISSQAIDGQTVR
jgi:hypothetical protein